MSKLVSSDCLGPLAVFTLMGFLSSDPGLDWGGPGVPRLQPLPAVGQQQLEAGAVILRGGPGHLGLVMGQLGRGGRP